MNRTWISALVLIVAIASPSVLFAHAGHPHRFMGTVSAVDTEQIEVEAKDGALLTFTLDADGNLEGTWGRGELTDVKFADGKVTFKRAFGGGGRGGGGGRPAGTMASEVTLEAGKLVGTMESPRGSIEFAGARKDS